MNHRRLLDGLDDEIRDHIERETRDNIERGMPPEEARAAALRKFGNITLVKEQTREVWIPPWFEQLCQDVRIGLRLLRRNPGFTLVALLTIALGIGMGTAVFSVVNAVLLRRLACPNPERLVWLADYDPNLKRDVVASSDFVEWRAQARSYTAMAAYGYQQAAIGTSKYASHVTGVVVSGDFWTITGARPAFGRVFGPEEQGAIVLSWELFERQFAADPRIVGSAVFFEGRPVTVTGVLPKDFRFQFPMWWISTRPQPVEVYAPLTPDDIRRSRFVNVVAALKPDVGVEQALAELEVLEKSIIDRRQARQPRALMGKLRIDPLQEKLTGGTRPALLVLLVAGVFLLLIACVNMTNLLLVRASARRNEIAVRAAVGAGRGRILRQLLVESLLLSLGGAAVGLLLAQWAITALTRISAYAVPRLVEASIDGRVLAFALTVSVVAGVLFGTGPSLSLWRVNPHESLKAGARSSAGPAQLRIRRILVASELALAVVPLVGAALMLKSSWRMNAHPPGFEPEKVLLLRVKLAGLRYRARLAQEAYMNELLRRVEQAPGVHSAGISNWFLFSGAPPFPADALPDQQHVIRLNAASTGYLKAIGMKLVKGRWLADTDPPDRVMLNESMARQAFGSVDPVGRQLSVPQPVTVVGVVGDLKYSQLDADPPPEVYVRYHQVPFLGGTDVAVLTDGDVAALAPSIRQLISDIDPTQPVYDVRTLERALADSIAPRRFNLFLMGTFAATSLLLAIVGVYGVIAWSVAERRHEIGVRTALGAQRGSVVRMVVWEGMSTALAGIAAGVAVALGLMRLMAGLLYDVRAGDPSVFIAVALALTATALLACWGPALKAAWIDPVAALRNE